MQNNGYYYYVEGFHRNGVDTMFEISDLADIERERQKEAHKAKIIYDELVFFPNGTLNGGWEEHKDILSKPLSIEALPKDLLATKS